MSHPYVSLVCVFLKVVKKTKNKHCPSDGTGKLPS